MTDTATLITQLRILVQLTRTEAQVARLRVAQANGDEVRDELRQNAADADARAARIAGALTDLGALPDPVTPLLGRVAVLVRGAVEQTQPLDEALLGDLVLVHQLHDRARYVAALADAADLPAVRALAADLEAAHTETVHWLTRVLVDLAGGQAALDASPLQRVAAQVTRAANAPTRPVLDDAAAAVSQTVGRAAGTIAEAGKEASEAVEQYAGRAAQAGLDAAGTAVSTGQEALAAGRDAAVQAADTAVSAGRGAATKAASTAAGAVAAVAGTGRDAATRTVDQVARILPGPGTPDAPVEPADDEVATTAATDSGPTEITPADTGLSEPDPSDSTAADDTEPVLPFPGFADLPAHAAVAALRTIDDPRVVAATLLFEQAHGNRPGVVAAAQLRAAALPAG
jgi:hypothetical protein